MYSTSTNCMYVCILCLQPLEEELWYYGEVSRKDAEQLLRKDGDYLIRYSKDKGPVLTMKWEGLAKHFIVQRTEDDPVSRGDQALNSLK